MRSMRLLDAADVDQVGAEAEDHRCDHAARLVHQRAHCRRMEMASRPTKIASPIRKWPMLSSRIWGIAAMGFDIVVGQAVAGMDFQAEIGAERRRVADMLQQPVALAARRHWHRRRCAVPPPARPASREASSCLRSGSMNMETRMPAAASALTMGFSRVSWPTHVDAAFGGALLALLRHDAGGMRPVLERDGQHLVGRRHFQIERNVQLARQPRDVVVGDMAAILAQMRGDAVGAGRLRQQRGAHRIGIVAAARIAHGRDMIDIDAEAEGFHADFPVAFKQVPWLPGFTAGMLRRCGGSLSACQAWHLPFRQRDQRHADLRLAAGAVDQAAGRHHLARPSP